MNKHLLEQLSQAVDQYNETASEELCLYEIWDSMNSMSEEEIKQAINELKVE